MPVRSPVPESGTILTVSSASPLAMIPLCCRTKEPDRPSTDPMKCSMAT